jgi:hypothetical protein
MLIRPGSDTPFPQNDLAYLAFLVTLKQLQFAFEGAQDDEAVDEPPLGFLDGQVPLLARLPAAAQLDLLVEVWARHAATRAHRATLLDAAVLYCICRHAFLTLREDPVVAQVAVAVAPRELDLRLDRWTRERVEILYDRWWPAFDPREVEIASSAVLEDFPRALVAPLLEAAHLEGPSPALGRRLKGLMSQRSIRELLSLIEQE